MPISLLLAYVFNNHDEEGQLDCKCLLWIKWAGNIIGANIGTHDFEDGRLNVWVSDSLNVTISNVLIPNLEWLRSAINIKGKVNAFGGGCV